MKVNFSKYKMRRGEPFNCTSMLGGCFYIDSEFEEDYVKAFNKGQKMYFQYCPFNKSENRPVRLFLDIDGTDDVYEVINSFYEIIGESLDLSGTPIETTDDIKTIVIPNSVNKKKFHVHFLTREDDRGICVSKETLKYLLSKMKHLPGVDTNVQGLRLLGSLKREGPAKGVYLCEKDLDVKTLRDTSILRHPDDYIVSLKTETVEEIHKRKIEKLKKQHQYSKMKGFIPPGIKIDDFLTYLPPCSQMTRQQWFKLLFCSVICFSDNDPNIEEKVEKYVNAEGIYEPDESYKIMMNINPSEFPHTKISCFYGLRNLLKETLFAQGKEGREKYEEWNDRFLKVLEVKPCLKSKNQKEIAEKFAEDRGIDIRVSSDPPKIYSFNQETKLWDVIADEDLIIKIGDWIDSNISKILKGLQDKTNDEDLGELEKRGLVRDIVKWKTTLKSNLNSWDFLNRVKKFVLRFLYDENFRDITNSKSHLFPIKGKKVIDLRTGEVRCRKREDFFTGESPCVLGDSSKVEEYMKKLLSGEKLDYLQKVLGFCITGHLPNRNLFNFIGRGGNGKTKLIYILKKIIPPSMIREVDCNVLAGKKMSSESARPGLSSILEHGVRLIVMSESPQGMKLNEEIIKALSGGDSIQHRSLFQNTKTSICQGKLILSSNETFEYNNSDAMDDRMKYIVFSNRFVDNPDPDKPNEVLKMKNIDSYIDNNLDNFLAWIVEGSIRYYKEGIKAPESVINSTRQISKECDTLLWTLENILIPSKGGYVKTSILRDRLCEEGINLTSKRLMCSLRHYNYTIVRYNGYSSLKGYKLSEYC